MYSKIRRTKFKYDWTKVYENMRKKNNSWNLNFYFLYYGTGSTPKFSPSNGLKEWEGEDI